MRVPCILVLAACAGTPALVSAREWSDSTGKYSVEAELVSADGNDVVLKKVDGQTVTVPLDRLSPEDRIFALTAAGEEHFRTFLVSIESDLTEVRSGETSLQRSKQWDDKIPACIARFQNQPMTFSFRIHNVTKAKGGYRLSIELVPPVSPPDRRWQNFLLRSMKSIVLDMKEKDALTIGKNSMLIINGVSRPELTHVIQTPENIVAMMQSMAEYGQYRTEATDWVACLENLAGTDLDVVFPLFRTTWRIENPPKREELQRHGKSAWAPTGHWAQETTTPADSRTKWLNTTYNKTIYHVDGTHWVERDNKTPPDREWHFTEIARTKEYIELSGFVFGTGRLYADKLLMKRGPKWEWASNGRWVSD